VDLAILAGGKSERFGKQKNTLPFGESTLLEFIANRLGSISSNIIVVKKNGTEIPPIKGIRIVQDASEERGAIVGIRTALLASREKYCFVFACDMPFLSLELIERMIHMDKGYDALVPVHSRGSEPLHAVYSKDCINTIDDCMSSEERSLHSVLSRVRTEYIPAELYCDPENAFFNINTRDDYERAVRLYLSRREEELCRW
jgi:molybdopterin-guanine dinucleotide biosynthesis protein A